jgi:hypothetical protein
MFGQTLAAELALARSQGTQSHKRAEAASSEASLRSDARRADLEHQQVFFIYLFIYFFSTNIFLFFKHVIILSSNIFLILLLCCVSQSSYTSIVSDLLSRIAALESECVTLRRCNAAHVLRAEQFKQSNDHTTVLDLN